MLNDYDGLATWYGLLLGDWHITVSNYVDLLGSILRVPNASRALDIACGTGIYLAALSKIVDMAVGIDRSENMLRVARRNLALFKHNVSLIRASWFNLPIAESANTIIVYMGNSLAHCLDDISLTRVLSEFRRVSGNGQIIVDCRKIKQSPRCPGFQQHGSGQVNGETYVVYDSRDVLPNHLYEITLVVKRVLATCEEEVFRTILRYRTDFKSVLLELAPRIGLVVEECVEVNDLGDLFDLIILSRR